MRWSRALVAPLLILLVTVACSSPAASTGGNGNGGNGSEQSQGSEPTPEATPGGGNGGNGGNGGSSGDAQAAFERLTPDNADQLTKTEAGGVIFAAFDTSESIESLTSFYEDAFNDLGLQIVSTTETGGGISWIVGNDPEASTFGGAISVFPASDGSGTQVSIQIGSTQ
jgi:hypothetical protein